MRTSREVDAVVSLANEALATSGDYRSFFEHNGQTYSHTIDPTTVRPVDHQLASVSVTAESCARADAFATAILVMGPEKGLAWAESNQVRAMLITRTADGSLSRATTAEFPDLELQQPSPQTTKASGNNFAQLVVAATVVFGIAILAMSVGTIIANRRLQGSCGGIAGLKDSGGKTICDMCTKPSPECSGNPEPIGETASDG